MILCIGRLNFNLLKKITTVFAEAGIEDASLHKEQYIVPLGKASKAPRALLVAQGEFLKNPRSQIVLFSQKDGLRKLQISQLEGYGISNPKPESGLGETVLRHFSCSHTLRDQFHRTLKQMDIEGVREVCFVITGCDKKRLYRILGRTNRFYPQFLANVRVITDYKKPTRLKPGKKMYYFKIPKSSSKK